ncbi:MAG: DUF4166 domain-containing protein [Pseudolysinimonas sp.]|uniref:DUF4166 domain-containing protein n=1 Tax=Pseudolysinimonas sp. TaxID=2680009 RepID=UPI0032640799
MSSPWEVALGTHLADLDPALRTYFSAIPSGKVGRGSGVFSRVGTPRRWLWPMLAVLGRAHIVFPVWAKDVPFEVVNTPGDGAIHAARTFHFVRGDRVMRDRVMYDEIRMTARGLVDRLGTRGRLEAPLEAQVVEGRLELRSRRAYLRLGAARIPIPFAPRVLLVESRVGDRQHVALTMDAPLIGRIYEYSGSFSYGIEDQ